MRTSTIWSAKSSAESTGLSGLISAAPNCNNSWRNKLCELKHSIKEIVQQCRQENQTEKRYTDKLSSYKPHVLEDWYDICKNCVVTRNMLLDKRIILESRKHLINHVHREKKSKLVDSLMKLPYITIWLLNFTMQKMGIHCIFSFLIPDNMLNLDSNSNYAHQECNYFDKVWQKFSILRKNYDFFFGNKSLFKSPSQCNLAIPIMYKNSWQCKFS